jgi:hypothetical protein
MRNRTNRVYRLSAAGVMALQAQRSVPRWYRTILAMFQGDTLSDQICDALSAHSKKQVIAWLEELETLGFIADAAPEPTETAIVVEQIIAVLKQAEAGAKVLA